MDNPLYEAAREGRYRIDIDVRRENNEYVARWEQHGQKVEVRDPSQMTAFNLASEQALEALKHASVFDQTYG